MSDTAPCPICGPVYEGNATTSHSNNDMKIFDCNVCGKYRITHEDWEDELKPEKANLNNIQRATVSHRLATEPRDQSTPMITTDWLRRVRDDARLPSPLEQAENIIRVIGDEVSRTGEPLDHLPANFAAIIGAPNPEFAGRLVLELIGRGRLTSIDMSSGDGVEVRDINLTLDGWEGYEAEKRGQFAGNYGFIALKFDDGVLDPFVDDVVKPVVKSETGYDLVDMRKVARAGIIDNIMREQIRDAAFVLVDLTHDNSGAYWEAGYAEGLGKPVIYICERSKFDEAKTHFDTNHCTTVLWSQDDHDRFREELIATLRRSLNLFPEAS